MVKPALLFACAALSFGCQDGLGNARPSDVSGERIDATGTWDGGDFELHLVQHDGALTGTAAGSHSSDPELTGEIRGSAFRIEFSLLQPDETEARYELEGIFFDQKEMRGSVRVSPEGAEGAWKEWVGLRRTPIPSDEDLTAYFGEYTGIVTTDLRGAILRKGDELTAILGEPREGEGEALLRVEHPSLQLEIPIVRIKSGTIIGASLEIDVTQAPFLMEYRPRNSDESDIIATLERR